MPYCEGSLSLFLRFLSNRDIAGILGQKVAGANSPQLTESRVHLCNCAPCKSPKNAIFRPERKLRLGLCEEFADRQGVVDLDVQLWRKRSKNRNQGRLGMFLDLNSLLEKENWGGNASCLAQFDHGVCIRKLEVLQQNNRPDGPTCIPLDCHGLLL